MKCSKDMLSRWTKYCRLLLAEKGYTCEQVQTGSDAWQIAHMLDIPKEAYHVGMNDNHIQTALKRIFHNVVFKG